MRILFVSANPSWTPRLDLLDELRELKHSLKGKQYVLELLPAAQPEDLRQAIDGNSADIDILHFTGHGTRDDGIFFRNTGRKKNPIDETDLNEFFKNKKVKLAVLNACHTQKIAKGITGFANTVIGTTKVVEEPAAKKMTKVLYAALGNGKSIDEAFEEATQTLEKTGHENVYMWDRLPTEEPEKIAFDSGEIEIDQENEDAWNRYFFEGYLGNQIESLEATIERDRKWAWRLLIGGGFVILLLAFPNFLSLNSIFPFLPDLSPETAEARKVAYENWVSFSGEHMLESITTFGKALPALFAGLKGRMVTHGNSELRSLTKLLELVKSSADMPQNMRDKLFSIVEQNMFGALTTTSQQLEKEEGTE
jgi:hypothetical protein